jgi:nucleotide-binding universal stress UspA family protein
MSIACGTDFSAPASHAAAAAAAVARRLGERLLLVHALDQRAVDELALPAARRAATERLEMAAQALRGPGLDIETIVVSGGAPDETIVDWTARGELRFADRTPPWEAPRFLMIAALGYRDASRWRLGSVAERIAQRAPLPVIVVRGVAGFHAWARDERPLRIFVAMDFTRSSLTTLQWVGVLRAAGPCDVVVGHVYHPPEEYHRLGILGPMDLIVGNAEVERVLIRELAARVGEIPGRGHCDIRIQQGFGQPAHHILQLAERERPDLIVVGAHQRGALGRLWHGSVSHGVAHFATVSVACVPAAEAPPITEALPPVRRVLAPTDFSELGNRAIRYAYGLVGAGGTVHLLHVIEPNMLPNPSYAHPGAERVPTLDEQSAQRATLVQQLEGLEPGDARQRGITTEVDIVADAEVGAAICETADRLEVDAICMSSHGHSGLSKLMAGSVAQRVLTQTRRPLFIIPVRQARDE